MAIWCCGRGKYEDGAELNWARRFQRFRIVIEARYENDFWDLQPFVRSVSQTLCGFTNEKQVDISLKTERYPSSSGRDLDTILAPFALLANVSRVNITGISRGWRSHLKKMMLGHPRCLPKMYYALERLAKSHKCCEEDLDKAWIATLTDKEKRFKVLRSSIVQRVTACTQEALAHLLEHDTESKEIATTRAHNHSITDQTIIDSGGIILSPEERSLDKLDNLPP